MKEKLARLKRLQTALASFKVANDIKSRVSAGKELTTALRELGAFARPVSLIGDLLGDNDEYSDNTNDENYRYADTGHIAGAHKERASNRIKDLAKDGQTVKSTDIEWDEIESDELLAEDVIKKSNIMGEVDYQAMKDDGGDAGTAFIIQKVFASIAPHPHWDIEYFVKNSQGGRRLIRSKDTESKVAFYEELGNYSTSDQKRAARRAYVNGINTLKSRISNIKDTRLLVSELKAIAGEMVGAKIGAEATDDYNASQAESDKIKVLIKDDFKRYVADYEDAKNKAKKEIELESGKNLDKAHLVFVDPETGFKVQKRDNDFWKTTRAIKRWLEYKNPSEEFVVIGGSSISTLAPLVTRNYVDKLNEITKKTNKQKLASSLDAFKDENANLAWISLGERFWGIIELTSGAFVKHANMSLNKRYDDWALVIKEDNTSDSTGTKKPTKKKKTFELIVADKIERKGGRPIAIRSTKELKDNFGFRDIQSGDWVLKDKNSAQFHVENAAAAMMDLSDIVGIDEKSLAFGGRLALALGARGRSGAKAHYEPVQRVINITKMKGGGSLGHEWFHAIDNILGEVLNIDGATGSQVFLSKNPEVLGDSDLGRAFSELKAAMRDGETREPLRFKVTQEGIDLAKRNMNPNTLYGTNAFIAANDLETSIIHLNDKLEKRRMNKKKHAAWVSIALGYHRKDDVGQTITLNVGDPMSSYLAESKRLDAGKSKSYWSSTLEMAARAFQAFLEDSLKDQDRRNDYLSYGADNSLYGGNHQAYPEGEERKRINAVFKRLFATIKDQKVFEKAAANTAMMDSIFGATILLDTQGDWSWG